jgi:Tol biopolymer transport system component
MNSTGAGAFSRVSGLASVSQDKGGSQPSISSDGGFIAFTSASNFDPNDTNGVDDVYRRDMNSTGAGAFSRVSGLASVSPDKGGNQPSISGIGRFIAFTSASNFDPNDTNGVDDVYRRDMCNP